MKNNVTTVPEGSRISDADITFLKTWEGRSEERHDVVAAAPVHGLAAMLDLACEARSSDGVLPALWHWLYFLPRTPQSELGADGHPKLGGFLPPVPLPRRMWAGGRLRWHAPLKIGDAISRVSRIMSVERKAGRAGDLVFVTLRHEVNNPRGLALVEEQDIVYRGPAPSGTPAPEPMVAQRGAFWFLEVVPDPVLLFRYSALTFNGHRIHYDRPYACEVEGYPGLVVHGPLVATLLAQVGQQRAGGRSPAAFEFKAVRPLHDLNAFSLCATPSLDGKGVALWTQDHQDFLTMQAAIHFD
jgi:3-methylfumaryl-CoA hydratase